MAAKKQAPTKTKTRAKTATAKPAASSPVVVEKAPRKRATPTPPPEPAPAPMPDLLPTSREETVQDQVRREHPIILAAYATGYALSQIGAELCSPPLTAIQIRIAIMSDTALTARFNAAKEHRAHEFVERAGQAGIKLVDTGFHKDGADTLLKVAAKTAPTIYGDKATIALTGANGGPVESTITLSPSEAYRKMMGKA